MPPAPRAETISYGPRRVPGPRGIGCQKGRADCKRISALGWHYDRLPGSPIIRGAVGSVLTYEMARGRIRSRRSRPHSRITRFIRLRPPHRHSGYLGIIAQYRYTVGI